MKKERGFTLVEMLVSVAILGVTGVAFLSGFSTASRGDSIIDERETAKNLAESQMEYIKNQAYTASIGAGTYAPTPIPWEYAGYSVTVSADNITSRDGNIQKIKVIVKRQDKEVTQLEGYKVN